MSEGMLRKSAADGKRKKWKSAKIFRMRDREKMNPNGESKKVTADSRGGICPCLPRPSRVVQHFIQCVRQLLGSGIVFAGDGVILRLEDQVFVGNIQRG